jgi:hypothetical protein
MQNAKCKIEEFFIIFIKIKSISLFQNFEFGFLDFGFFMKIKCPTCKKWGEWENNPYRPFCSERCKLIDLGRWAAEEYRIEGEKTSEKPKNEED